ncbi:hypothetical protein FXO38_10763 [Capsicum annuum]|nr:hypothetical protein FXO37_15735 [Capsicum annuum]KAF3663219.1 hypothetical protein FXO38_10763 [Capsicum annuum]
MTKLVSESRLKVLDYGAVFGGWGVLFMDTTITQDETSGRRFLRKDSIAKIRGNSRLERVNRKLQPKNLWTNMVEYDTQSSVIKAIQGCLVDVLPVARLENFSLARIGGPGSTANMYFVKYIENHLMILPRKMKLVGDGFFVRILLLRLDSSPYNPNHHTGYMGSALDWVGKPPIQVYHKDWCINKGDTQDHTTWCHIPNQSTYHDSAPVHKAGLLTLVPSWKDMNQGNLAWNLLSIGSTMLYTTASLFYDASENFERVDNILFSSFYYFSIASTTPPNGLPPKKDEKISNGGGRFLGLVNSSQLIKNKFVAIAFDTKKDLLFYDPDDNHVGLDIDSLILIKTANVMLVGIDLKSRNLISSWIDYKSDETKLMVFLSFSSSKPKKPILIVDATYQRK